jgi:hypothetical protein
MEKFPQGLSVKPPRPGAPEYIKASLSIKKTEFIHWLQTTDMSNNWLNLDIKVSKGDKWYVQINDWKPKKKEDDGSVDMPPGLIDEMPEF